VPPVVTGDNDFTEIRSANTATLTSVGLESVRDIISKAEAERARLIPELHQARANAEQLTARLDRWANGWLFRRVFKASHAKLQQRTGDANARRDELQEQERLSRMATDFDLPPDLKDFFGRLIDATAALGAVQRFWDTVSARSIDRIRERTVATRSIERVSVKAGLGGCELVDTPWKVPQLANSNGGELLIYPAFILYRVSNNAFALVDIRETKIDYASVSFQEEESIPGDSRVIGHTWAKANKDGSPDRRFANNYQIPIAEYGRLRITSGTGLNEEYMASNATIAAQFAKAWKEFAAKIPTDTA
jgi:hypothetical protein